MIFLSVSPFLKLFLIEWNTVCTVNPIEFKVESASHKIITSFNKAVDDPYKKEPSIPFYANALFTTPDQLKQRG